MRRVRRVVLAFLFAAISGVAASCGGRGGGGSSSSSLSSTPTSTTPGSTAAPAPPAPPPKPAYVQRTKNAKLVARHGEGFLEDVNGERFLHVKGAPYDRGVQYGFLLGDEVDACRQALNGYAATLLPQFQVLLNPLMGIVQPFVAKLIANLYRPYFTPESLDMIRGIVDGAAQRNPPVALSEEEMIFLSSIVDVGATVQVPAFKCSGHAVWGPRTQSGKMYQLRNVDLFVGTGIESHASCVLEKPDGGNAFLNAGFSGLVGPVSGMNEHGVGISQIWAYSNDAGIGQPWPITCRTILETAQNVDSVRPAFAGVTRTYGSNFVFADRGDGRSSGPRAIALESTHLDLAQFVDNDPTEDASFQGAPLAIRMPNAVFRGDLPLCQRIHARQYNDNGDPRQHGYYQNRYKQQADMTAAYEAQGVKIGTAEMEAISRQIAMQSSSLQCVVYENTDLVVHVAHSRIVPGAAPSIASNEPFRDFDLDYYLPTSKAKTDKASYGSGETIQLTLAVENHGRPRKLDAAVTLEAGGATFALAPASGIEALPGAPGNATWSCLLPAGVPSGSATLVVELRETGTQDTVDFSCVALTIK